MADTSTKTATDAGRVEVVSPTPDLPQTGTPSWSQLTEDVGFLDNRAKLLHDDTGELHGEVLLKEWGVKTTEFVRMDVPTLLGKLSDLGFAWRDIARLIGVSVPAVQKWRRGASVSGESRTSAAAALAACHMISEHYMVQDVAQWFESPILLGVPVTPLDLYAARHVDLVFRLASGKTDPEAVLGVFDPEWRETYRSDFEVFEAEDGLALRRKDL